MGKINHSSLAKRSRDSCNLSKSFNLGARRRNPIGWTLTSGIHYPAVLILSDVNCCVKDRKCGVHFKGKTSLFQVIMFPCLMECLLTTGTKSVMIIGPDYPFVYYLYPERSQRILISTLPPPLHFWHIYSFQLVFLNGPSLDLSAVLGIVLPVNACLNHASKETHLKFLAERVCQVADPPLGTSHLY